MQTEEYVNLAPNFIEEEKSSLRDLLYILFRHMRKIILLFVVIVTSVTIFTYRASEVYQSDAKLLIRVGRESVSMDPTVVGPTVSVSQSRENEVNSELSIIKSRFLAEQVVDKIGAMPFLLQPNRDVSELDLSSSASVREKSIRRIMNNLEVGVEKKSHIINLSFQAQDPQLAQNALNILLDSYLEHHIDVHGTQASPQFFQEQSDKFSKDLKQKEDQLRQFQEEHGIVSIKGQKDMLLGQISSLQNKIDEALGHISSSWAKITSLQRALRQRSENMKTSRIVKGKPNYAADAIKRRLFDLRLKEVDLAARYPDDFRPLVEVRKQIKLSESALEKEAETYTEVTTDIDPNYQAMQLALETERAQLQAQIARKQSLTDELAKRKGTLTTLVGYGVAHSRMERDIKVLENEYLKYRENLQRANVSLALDMDKVSNVSIVQGATMPIHPIKPRKKLNITLGIFLGLFGGIGLAFFIEYFDDSLNTNEDVEKRLGLPVLASIAYKEF